ncbi:MAG TPA: nitrilase-related carbon-nitrogen hydrolase, partial [Anaerolineae bacterium]|nr:nitrilase-related carbon-nitrogen hydrolase [Anaerolineae bacterium]
KIVSWQEEAGFVLEEDKQNVLDRAAALAKQYGAYIDVALGVFKRTTALPYVLNQSILIDNLGNIRWTYDKTHPVFLGEDLVTINGIGQLPVIDTPYGRLSGAICNDMNFPALIRQAGQNNVDILITPYNDAGGFARADAVTGNYRAIENGVSLVRATGNGFSTIADYEGRILGSQDYSVASNSGIVLTTIPVQGVITIYSRIGDLFAYLCAAGLIILAGWTFFHRKRPASLIQQ